MKLLRGDHVFIKPPNIMGEVIEPDIRTPETALAIAAGYGVLRDELK